MARRSDGSELRHRSDDSNEEEIARGNAGHDRDGLGIREAGASGGDIVNAAIQHGLGAIFKKHPAFRDYQEYIARHVDKKRLEEGIRTIGEYVQRNGRNWGEEDKARFMYENIASFVASGRAFDDSAKKVILGESLEEKAERGGGLFGRRARRSDVEGEKYIEEATEAFRDIVSIANSSGHAERMPELVGAAQVIYDLGFLKTAMNILESKGLIEKREYREIMNSIDKKRKLAYQQFGSAVNKYVSAEEAQRGGTHAEGAQREKYKTAERVAASVIGILGLGIAIFAKQGITGNVIGVSRASSFGGVAGFLLILISVVLFLKK